MTAAAIRRGGTRRKPPTRAPGLLARTAARVPLDARTVERLVTVLILGVIAAGLVAVAAMLDLPRRAWLATGEAVGHAGLQVRQIDVSGLEHMDRQSVYAVALDQRSVAMPLVDLEGVRARLLQYGWVADAKVSRRLPDTLAIAIVERRPAAVWQHEGQLTLVDATGIPLEPVRLDAMPDLPVVIGPDANAQAASLTRLTDAAPRLKPLIAAATWVGGRRWDLRFATGETVMLPEGDGAAGGALRRFAELDAERRLLGQHAIRFDLRLPGRMVILPGAGHDAGPDKTPSAPAPATPAPAARPLNPALAI